MKIRRAKIKLVTERCSNTREMRRTHSRRVRHTHTQAGLMMVPPLLSPWQWFHPTTHSTAEAQSGHNTTQTHWAQGSFFSFLGGRGSASEDQTYRWLPVTHHHYISAQYHHIPEVTLSRGDERKTGKEGRRASLFVTCSQPGIRGPLHCPKCWAGQHT